MILRDEADRKKFHANCVEFVGCIKTLYDRLGLDENQAAAAITTALHWLIRIDGKDWKVLQDYATSAVRLLPNLLWDQSPPCDPEATLLNVTERAAACMKRIILCETAESFLRRLGAEKGIDFYALTMLMRDD